MFTSRDMDKTQSAYSTLRDGQSLSMGNPRNQDSSGQVVTRLVSHTVNIHYVQRVMRENNRNSVVCRFTDLECGCIVHVKQIHMSAIDD